MIFKYYWKRHWNNDKVLAFLQGRYFISSLSGSSSEYFSTAVTNIFLDSLFTFWHVPENLRINAQTAFVYLYNEGLISRRKNQALEVYTVKNTTSLTHSLEGELIHKGEFHWYFLFEPIKTKILSLLQEKTWIGTLKSKLVFEIDRLGDIALNTNQGSQIRIPIIYCEECGETTIPIELIKNYAVSRKIVCPYCHEQAIWDDSRLTINAAIQLCYFVSLIQSESYVSTMLPTIITKESVWSKNLFFLIAVLVWGVLKKEIVSKKD